MGEPVIVTATDPETGETDRQELQPGQWCLTVTDPMYLAGERRYGNGTVLLMLKRRQPAEGGQDG